MAYYLSKNREGDEVKLSFLEQEFNKIRAKALNDLNNSYKQTYHIWLRDRSQLKQKNEDLKRELQKLSDGRMHRQDHKSTAHQPGFTNIDQNGKIISDFSGYYNAPSGKNSSMNKPENADRRIKALKEQIDKLNDIIAKRDLELDKKENLNDLLAIENRDLKRRCREYEFQISDLESKLFEQPSARRYDISSLNTKRFEANILPSILDASMGNQFNYSGNYGMDTRRSDNNLAALREYNGKNMPKGVTGATPRNTNRSGTVAAVGNRNTDYLAKRNQSNPRTAHCKSHIKSELPKSKPTGKTSDKYANQPVLAKNREAGQYANSAQLLAFNLMQQQQRQELLALNQAQLAAASQQPPMSSLNAYPQYRTPLPDLKSADTETSHNHATSTMLPQISTT